MNNEQLYILTQNLLEEKSRKNPKELSIDRCLLFTVSCSLFTVKILPESSWREIFP